MHFFQIEQDDTNASNTDNTDALTQRMRNSASTYLASCLAFANTEAGQKLIARTIVVIVLVSASLIFSTAFKTASTVGLSNKSDITLYPTRIRPTGVKDNCGFVIFPNEYCTYEFSSSKKYIEIKTSNGGELHIDNKCRTALKNGPNDKELVSHGISFWTCYVNYDDTAANSTSANAMLPESYINPSDLTPHLRGTIVSKNRDIAEKPSFKI